MKRIGLTAVGVLGVLIGLGFVLPAVAKLRMTGVLPAADIGLLLLGLALAVGGPLTAILCCRKRGA